MNETAMWRQKLGQIAYEADSQHFSDCFPRAQPPAPWWRLSIQTVEQWEAIAAAVEQAVLTRQRDGGL